MKLPGREMDMDILDVDRDICVLPDEFPVVVDKTDVKPQVGCDPDSYLSKRYVEVDIVDTRRNLPGVVPGMFDVTAAVPMTLPVDEEKDSQVEEGPDVLSGRDMDMGIAISRC